MNLIHNLTYWASRQWQALGNLFPVLHTHAHARFVQPSAWRRPKHNLNELLSPRSELSLRPSSIPSSFSCAHLSKGLKQLFSSSSATSTACWTPLFVSGDSTLVFLQQMHNSSGMLADSQVRSAGTGRKRLWPLFRDKSFYRLIRYRVQVTEVEQRFVQVERCREPAVVDSHILHCRVVNL